MMPGFDKVHASLVSQPKHMLVLALLALAGFAALVALFAPRSVKAGVLAWLALP